MYTDFCVSLKVIGQEIEFRAFAFFEPAAPDNAVHSRVSEGLSFNVADGRSSPDPLSGGLSILNNSVPEVMGISEDAVEI